MARRSPRDRPPQDARNVDPLRELVGRVVARHGHDFEFWFPASFDWLAACADVVHVVQRAANLSRPIGDESARALTAAADEYFRLGYLGGLFTLAADDPHDADPEGLVASLVEPLDDEAEEAFGELVARHLDEIEVRLGGDSTPLPAASEWIVEIAERAWALLASWFETTEAHQRTRFRPYLLAYTRLGAALSALRWALADRR